MPEKPAITQLSRRAVARGAAWTVPTLAVGTAAPALAASGITIRNAGYVNSGYFTDCDGTFVNIDGTTSSPTANAGYTVQNSNSSTTIANITLTFYLPIQGLTFTAMAGSNPGWTTLKAGTGQQTVNGVTYYAYTSTYAGSVAAKAPNTTINYGWESNCSSNQVSNKSFIATSTATVNGATSTTNSGVAQMVSDD